MKITLMNYKPSGLRFTSYDDVSECQSEVPCPSPTPTTTVTKTNTAHQQIRY